MSLRVLEVRKHVDPRSKTASALRSALLDRGRACRPEDLRELELEVAKVVESAIGSAALLRAERRRRWALRGLGVLAALGVVAFSILRFTSASYPYRVSSAHSGFPIEDHIGRIHAYGLVLHTQQQPEPWVEIDLEEERAISTVILKNRPDCCHERGLPLIVEIAGRDRKWMAVGKRTDKYDKWVLNFPPKAARYVRLRSTGNTVLQFREIQVK